VLVSLELSPRKIAWMMIVDQNLPVLPVAPEVVAHDPFTAALYAHPCSAPTVCIGAGIDGIRQDVM
jgi:hypothetical protein